MNNIFGSKHKRINTFCFGLVGIAKRAFMPERHSQNDVAPEDKRLRHKTAPEPRGNYPALPCAIESPETRNELPCYGCVGKSPSHDSRRDSGSE